MGELARQILNVHYVSYMGIVVALIVVSVMVDLFTGLGKAKARHEAISSKGLRQTFRKLLEYWGLILMCFTIDLLLLITPIGEPWVTMACGLSIVIVEIKSVIENLKARRSKAADAANLLQKIISASDNEQAKKIIDAIKEL